MEDYVTFEQAVKLKELGFDWECNHFYSNMGNPTLLNIAIGGFYQNSNEFDNTYSAPTLAQTQKWLRDVKEICVTSGIKIHKGKYKFNWSITLFKEGRGIWDESVIYDTYEEALSAGIDEALELLK